MVAKRLQQQAKLMRPGWLNGKLDVGGGFSDTGTIYRIKKWLKWLQDGWTCPPIKLKNNGK